MADDLDVARGHERAFLLSVSHDLRTPLTSIRGYAEAIADGTVEGKDARIRAADVISSESRRLERLVADLLDLARLDAHQFSLHPAPVDARAVVRDAVEAFGPAAAELGVALDVDTGDVVPAVADAQRLAQIVANLVENALKFATTRVAVGVRGRRRSRRAARRRRRRRHRAGDLPRVFERLYTSRTVPGRTLGHRHRPRDRARARAWRWAATRASSRSTRVGTRFVVTFPERGQLRASASTARARPPSQRSSTVAGGSTSRRT